MKREPVAIIGAVGVLVGAVLVCLAEFGVPLTEGQQTAVQGVVAAGVAIVTILLSRSKVTPVDRPAPPVDGDPAPDGLNSI